jgi:DNA-binding transcriptional regulator YbjK
MRLSPERRRQIIIEAACRVAKRVGRNAVTLRETAAECSPKTSLALVKHYFSNQNVLHDEIHKRLSS